MELFKELSELGYKHYTENTVEELDNLQLRSEERIMEQTLAFRWFREKHKLSGVPKHHSFEIWDLSTEECVFEAYLVDSFEEAEIACLRKMIATVKKKKQKTEN